MDGIETLLATLSADPEFKRRLAENSFMHSLDWTDSQLKRYNARLFDLGARQIRWRPSRLSLEGVLR
jgi:hypothetical protein